MPRMALWKAHKKLLEAWNELDTDTKTALWLAPTKGGCFTTVERAIMKSDRWAALSREMKVGDK